MHVSVDHEEHEFKSLFLSNSAKALASPKDPPLNAQVLCLSIGQNAVRWCQQSRGRN